MFLLRYTDCTVKVKQTIAIKSNASLIGSKKVSIRIERSFFFFFGKKLCVYVFVRRSRW